MDVALFNPDGLPTVDPIEQTANELAVRANILPQTLAGRLFGHFWRACGGRPGTLTTSLSALRAEFPEDSDSNVRLALALLKKRGLIDFPEAKRRQGSFAVGVRQGAPQDAQWRLFDDRAAKTTLTIVSNDRDCAEPLRRTAQNRCAEASAEKKATPDASLTREVSELIKRKAAAARGHLAREFLERSDVPPKISFDVQNVLERSVVEKNERPGNVESMQKGEAFLRLVERIGRKLPRPPNDPCPWLVPAAAFCVHPGPLSEATLESALESCPNWPALTGAIRKQLAKCSEAELKTCLLWDDETRAARFPHRWDAMRRLASQLGIDPDDRWFRKAKKGGVQGRMPPVGGNGAETAEPDG